MEPALGEIAEDRALDERLDLGREVTAGALVVLAMKSPPSFVKLV